ncbi:MAG: bifunctional UDP-N-acetylmuramoyl-tripeptide:D-alanyl-D-alanine ligase/alanine racemase [Cytophagaceae bacterium]|jgi:alanine racemase|nr:bifunctional UDP-N-acetylmuramoyl-tripeptide:D-alanyl-D-alanine ligase/alanine racemase [Cytophagaceae bacterium]
MFSYSLSEVASICKGTLAGEDRSFQYLLTDSRRLALAADTMFVALVSTRNNGHLYLHELVDKGLRCFLVSEADYLPAGASGVVVPDTLLALQQLVAFHRQRFNMPVVAITGSNGKTIVKEWLAQLCLSGFRVVKNPKSYNSQIGVPLSVWEMDAGHNLGIFEAGISRKNEMHRLATIIQPTYGLLTNIGTAHDEGFENREEKIKEKLGLFAGAEWFLYRAETADVKALAEALQLPAISWSTNGQGDIAVQWERGSLHIQWNKKTYSFPLVFQDAASRENLSHAVIMALLLGAPEDSIVAALQSLQSVGMRLALQEGIHGCLLIDDSYSNDLAGLSIALDFLKQQSRHTRKTIILSDLSLEGEEDPVPYQTIAQLLKERDVQRMIGIGPRLSHYKDLFSLEISTYPSTEKFLEVLDTQPFQNETILIKGGRKFAFERISRKLKQRVHGTYMEVNLDALVHNFNFYRAQLKPGTKIMVMVKAFAYGNGAFEVAHLLQYHRCDYLAVAYADEGVSLRQHGVSLPIMVMNPNPASFEKLVQYQLEPELYNLSIAREYIEYLQRNAFRSVVHVKIDTGMKRLGFEEEDFSGLLALLDPKWVQVASVFSHLAGADEAMFNDFSKKQIELFDRLYKQLTLRLGYQPLAHIVNSAGIIRFPEAHFDMVRLGIGLYGVEASSMRPNALQTVARLKTVISQVKKVKKGESVGYSRKWIATRDTTTATIAIGYADGYSRRFGNGTGIVMVHGKRCPVIGNVCMDMCMIDVTEVAVKEGDEVELFGNQLSIVELAERGGTIAYELLTSVSQRVNRIFYSE